MTPNFEDNWHGSGTNAPRRGGIIMLSLKYRSFDPMPAWQGIAAIICNT
ncbi:hypothetical protein [Paraburkholderia silvatlantica]